jgi:hypothetical protein
MLSLTPGLSTRDRVASNGGELIVNHVSFDRETDVDDVLAGTAQPIAATATQDGRHLHNPLGWHEGDAEDLDSWIYYERYELHNGATVCAAHGFIHRESRQLLQSG